ncbi:MAG: HAMP domain-containing histidine kinase [Clostridia bacterium]|nr:HAMP domain-containing histidine kinase [Clostridia bacterium]
MIRKLQMRFVVVAITAVVVVLTLLLGIINVANYISFVEDSDKMLDLISGNGGFFPYNSDSDISEPGSTEQGSDVPDSIVSGTTEPSGMNSDETPPDKTIDLHNNISKMPDGSFGPEAAYETRFFAVEFDANGYVTLTNTGSIAAVSSESAVELAQQVYDSGKSHGFLDVYRYSVTETEGGTLVLFLNRSRELSAVQSFARTSAGVALIGIICVFLLVVLLSKRAIKPLAESYEKQKCFITDASHELKTPLTIINSSTEVLEMTQGENEWTDSIKSQVSRLTKLTNDLVSLTRMDESGSKLIKTDFSFSDAVIEAIEPYQNLARSEGKRFELNCPGNISYCGNEDSIRKLAVILADNAIKYSDNRGSIAVSVKQTGRGTVLKFINTVNQIEKGNHDELFERFYRADNSRNSSTGGYGIGLSIAKSIVQAHRGKISARSENGKSLEITVIL